MSLHGYLSHINMDKDVSQLLRSQFSHASHAEPLVALAVIYRCSSISTTHSKRKQIHRVTHTVSQPTTWALYLIEISAVQYDAVTLTRHGPTMNPTKLVVAVCDF